MFMVRFFVFVRMKKGFPLRLRNQLQMRRGTVVHWIYDTTLYYILIVMILL